MFIEKMINILPVKSGNLKLLIGAITVALIVSLGMILISSLLDFSIGTVLPATFGAIGAAIFSAKNFSEGHIFKY